MSTIKRAIVQALFSHKTQKLTQKFGINLTHHHYYGPVPDARYLEGATDLWEKASDLPGIDLNDENHLRFLNEIFPQYQNEFDFSLNKTGNPHDYFINNGAFGLVSATVLHSMVRHFKPETVLEVGSGNSTYVSARASLLNADGGQSTQVVSIEPYPNPVLRNGFPGLTKLVSMKVEEVGLDPFTQLKSGDILFIDTSHVVRTGGDVNFLYLEVLPRLEKGVIVHIHDIFLPKEYPRDWVIGQQRYWTEQYLLQAFLAFNSHFEVLWCGSYAYLKFLDELKKAFPPPEGLGSRENYFSSSFWMKKVG